VENAKLLLETQVDYVMKHKELRANESEMRQKLYDMEASYGMVPQYQRRGPFNANTNANAGQSVEGPRNSITTGVTGGGRSRG
jgi:DNA-directed RNA polymerase subunit H (RpoH/RPB5)